MNNREVILNILKHKKVKRIPFMPLATRTWWFSQPEYKKKFEPCWNELGQFIPDVEFEKEIEDIDYRSKLFQDLGITFVQWGLQHGGNHFLLKENPKKGVEITRIRNKNNTAFEFIFKTPLGSIAQKSHLIRGSIAIEQPLIKTLNDYKVFKYILENQKKVSWPGLNKFAEEILAVIRDRGIVFCTGPVPPIMHWIFTVLGVEGVTFGLRDFKKELEQLIELQHSINLKYLDIVIKTPFKIIYSGGVNGTGMINPDIYNNYYLPYHQEYSKIIKKSNKIYLSHSSGESKGAILPSIEKTGLDGLYGFIYPVHPDELSLAEVCKRWEGKMTVMGGIDPHLLATYTPNKISEVVKKIINEVGNYSNFILGTSDDIAYGTPFKNLEIIPKILEEIQ